MLPAMEGKGPVKRGPGTELRPALMQGQANVRLWRCSYLLNIKDSSIESVWALMRSSSRENEQAERRSPSGSRPTGVDGLLRMRRRMGSPGGVGIALSSAAPATMSERSITTLANR